MHGTHLAGVQACACEGASTTSEGFVLARDYTLLFSDVSRCKNLGPCQKRQKRQKRQKVDPPCIRPCGGCRASRRRGLKSVGPVGRIVGVFMQLVVRSGGVRPPTCGMADDASLRGCGLTRDWRIDVEREMPPRTTVLSNAPCCRRSSPASPLLLCRAAITTGWPSACFRGTRGDRSPEFLRLHRRRAPAG
jgi:hypothetical protein